MNAINRTIIENIPSDILFILNESVEVRVPESKDPIRILQIKNLTSEEYANIMNRPYIFPPRNQAWKVYGAGKVYLIWNKFSEEEDIVYKIRYVRKPSPIILCDLVQDYGTTIEDLSGPLDCKLNSSLHQEILQRAVELAKAAYQGDLNSTVELGKRSE